MDKEINAEANPQYKILIMIIQESKLFYDRTIFLMRFNTAVNFNFLLIRRAYYLHHKNINGKLHIFKLTIRYWDKAIVFFFSFDRACR